MTQIYPLATKYCNRFEIENLTNEFSKRKASLDGLQRYCRDCMSVYHSKWQDENREHRNKYMRNIYQNNEEHRLTHLNRVRIYQAVKNKKVSLSISLLGHPISVVNLWLDFTGNYTTRSPLMHIDNFIPCAKFDLKDPGQRKECFKWMNQRIIPASENLSKNAKLPTKTEYLNHINMCHDFTMKEEGLTSDGKALHLMYNTVYRFFNQCP